MHAVRDPFARVSQIGRLSRSVQCQIDADIQSNAGPKRLPEMVVSETPLGLREDVEVHNALVERGIPFENGFPRVVAQPEFLEGRFHTTYLDEVLKARNGRPFAEPGPEVEEVAIIAAAIHASWSPAAIAGAPAAAGAPRTIDRWKMQARLDGLRDGGRAGHGTRL